jgi:hypothetical protein
MNSSGLRAAAAALPGARHEHHVWNLGVMLLDRFPGRFQRGDDPRPLLLRHAENPSVVTL